MITLTFGNHSGSNGYSNGGYGGGNVNGYSGGGGFSSGGYGGSYSGSGGDRMSNLGAGLKNQNWGMLLISWSGTESKGLT